MPFEIHSKFDPIMTHLAFFICPIVVYAHDHARTELRFADNCRRPLSKPFAPIWVVWRTCIFWNPGRLVFLGCSLETGFETTLETVFETRGGGNSWLSMARASARSRLPLGFAKLIIGLPVLLLTLVYVLLSLPMFEGIAC